MSDIDALFARRGMSLDRLRSLVAVADAGGMAAAAPDEPAKQSQLSRQISQLEDFLGVALTERAGRRLQLTEAGLLLVEETRHFFRAIAGLRERGEDATPVHLSLGAGDAVLHFQVIPALAAVRRSHPRAVLSVAAAPNDEIEARVRDGRLDAGLLRGGQLRRPLKGARVGTWDCALYVPRGLLGGRTTVEAVLRDVPLALQMSEARFVETVTTAAEAHGVSLRPELACETFPQALQAVRSGAFAAILPTSVELPVSEVTVLRGAALGKHAAPLWLVHEPRLVRVRPATAGVLEALRAAIAGT